MQARGSSCHFASRNGEREGVRTHDLLIKSQGSTLKRMQALRRDAASGKAITRLPSASAVTISRSQRQGSSGSQQTRGTLPTHSGGLKVPDRALAYPQHQQARGCEWRQDDKRHRDTDENRQETNPAGDGANCFHDVPLSTVDLAAPLRAPAKDDLTSGEIQACSNRPEPQEVLRRSDEPSSSRIKAKKAHPTAAASRL